MLPTSAAELPQSLMPLFSALLIIARSPGTPLTAAQEEKFGQVLPPQAVEMIKSLSTVVPEDPQVAQLKKIAEKLESIEAKLLANSGSETEAAAASAPEE